MTRAPIRDFMCARSGKMETIGAETHSKRGIPRNENDETQRLRDAQKFGGKFGAAFRIASADQDETPRRQGARRRHRVRETLVVGHQGKRRPVGGAFARRVEAGGRPC